MLQFLLRIHLIFTVCVLLYSQDAVEGIEVDKLNTTPPPLPPIPSKNAGFLIPKPPSFVNYKVYGKLKALSSGGYDPYHDGPSFVNFASIGTGTMYGPIYSPGTCYGICYMSSIWFAGIVKKLDENNLTEDGSEVKTIGERYLNFGKGYQKQEDTCYNEFGDIVTCPELPNPDEIGSIRMDGLTYLASWAKLSNTKFFNSCGYDFVKCRLYKVSQNEKLNLFAKQTMTHHQFHQFAAKKIDLKVNQPNKLAEQIEDIRQRVIAHGTVMFYWYVYSADDSWSPGSGNDSGEVVWNKFEAAHAMLIYKVSEAKVKVKGTSTKALKLHLYDPNKIYRNYRALTTAEGIGTYLLYFPETKTITFSNKMRKIYSRNSKETAGDSVNLAVDLQRKSPTVDGKQTVIGYTDFYEGHKDQFIDSVNFDTFYSGAIMTPLDIKLFDLFAGSEDCNHIKSEISKLKANKSSDDYEFIKTWFQDNYAALQNHLKIQQVISDDENCEPFDN